MTRGEVYYANLGRTRGSEQGGIRPVLIVQNDVGNKYSSTTIICPLTSQYKPNLPTHVEVFGLHKPSIVLCEQIRVIDVKQVFEEKLLYVLTDEEMENVNKAIKVSVGVE